MKKFFIATLVFLFLSCSNSGKQIADNDSTAENHDNDNIESVDSDTGEPETTDGEMTAPDEDNENIEKEDDDDDTEPLQGICLEEPCKDVENSIGKCLLKGSEDDYVCVCEENFVWIPNKKTCEPVSSFKGLSCTGQTKCYDNEHEIPCPKAGEPFFGQDANYAEKKECVPQNFTIKNYGSDKTVIDNNSKLEWVLEVFNNKDNISINTDNEAVKEYLDWRTATFKDYNSIIDSGTSDPAINEAYFPETPSDIFVTANFEYLDHTGPQEGTYYRFTGGINFETGISESSMDYSISKSDKLNSRMVRALPEKQESFTLTFSSDEYKIANLLPQKLLLLKAPEKDKNWQEALEYCENLTYAGISDWHLPNRNEANFIYESEYSPLWSSTSYTNDPTQAIVYATAVYPELFYFCYNSVTTKNKTDKAISACVAFDPCPEGKIWNGEKCTSFDELGLKSDGSSCKQEGYSWGNSQCVKTCDDDLCKDKAHSTGLCLQVINDGNSQRVYCKCEENYFIDQYNYSEFECVNPCEQNPCTGEGSAGNCVAENAHEFICGCKKGYYFDSSSKTCVPLTTNDCFIDYYSDVCINTVSGLLWSSTSEDPLEWSAAKKYCEDLDEAGFSDWRLPKVEELWTFAKSCIVNPKEACKASESNGCLSEECISQCVCQQDYSIYTNLWHWSSSFKQNDPEKVIAFSLYGYFLEFHDIKRDVAEVKCVRNIE